MPEPRRRSPDPDDRREDPSPSTALTAWRKAPMNQSRKKTARPTKIQPMVMRSRCPLSEYHWITFEGAELESGSPL